MQVSRRLAALLDRRKSRRRRIFLQATLMVGAVVQAAHLLDVSESGALLHVEQPPKVGFGVTIKAAGVELLARVVWVEGGYIGVAFVHRLTPECVERLAAADCDLKRREETIASARSS